MWTSPGTLAQARPTKAQAGRYRLEALFDKQTVGSWDPRKYLEYRLFWPYSSGMQPLNEPRMNLSTLVYRTETPEKCSGQWWYLSQWKRWRKTGIPPRQCLIMVPKMTLTMVFRWCLCRGCTTAMKTHPRFIISVGGELNLITNKVSPRGLTEGHAKAMGMKSQFTTRSSFTELAEKVVASANTGADNLTSSHVRKLDGMCTQQKGDQCACWSRLLSQHCQYYDNGCGNVPARKPLLMKKTQEVIRRGNKVFKY